MGEFVNSVAPSESFIFLSSMTGALPPFFTLKWNIWKGPKF